MATEPDTKLSQELVRSLAERTVQLRAAATVANAEPPDPRDDPVRQALRRAAELTRAASDLGATANATALSIVSRATLENLITLLWVVISETNARELEAATLGELARVARVNLEKGNARVVNKKTGENATKEVLSGEKFKNITRRRSVEEQAKAANVHHLYDIFYRFLSLDTHGRSAPVEAASEVAAATVMHLQGVGALTMAIGHAGALWLIHRQRVDNETLRKLLGFDR